MENNRRACRAPVYSPFSCGDTMQRLGPDCRLRAAEGALVSRTPLLCEECVKLFPITAEANAPSAWFPAPSSCCGTPPRTDTWLCRGPHALQWPYRAACAAPVRCAPITRGARAGRSSRTRSDAAVPALCCGDATTCRVCRLPVGTLQTDSLACLGAGGVLRCPRCSS